MIENVAGKAPASMPAIPTPGRWVHYVSAGSADGRFPSVCRAALVTEAVAPDGIGAEVAKVGLMVCNPTGLHFRPIADGGADYDPENRPTTWHWPERA